MPPAPSSRLALFEAELARIESVRRGFTSHRPLYAKGFLALTVAGFACFAFGRFPGLWGGGCATFVSLAGWAMVSRRESELSAEVETLRAEIARMRRIESREVRAPSAPSAQ